jgi:Ca2+-binding EF-hand superfamily protein
MSNPVDHSFERELKNKLSQKASGSQSEETVLMKAFKYFDLNNNGTVEPEEFAKAIEKIGIMIPTKQVSVIVSSGTGPYGNS